MTARRLAFAAALAGGLSVASTATGDPMLSEDFNDGASAQWTFFTDQVMGGVSTGRAALDSDGNAQFLRLQGQVSTANNGGFIQARWEPSERVPETARGVEIEVRGNGQTYYLHVRTTATRLPWQFYQAPFETTAGWAVLQIPFTDFAAKGRLLGATITPEAIRSLAVVAYGRDHVADVSVRRVGFY